MDVDIMGFGNMVADERQCIVRGLTGMDDDGFVQ